MSAPDYIEEQVFDGIDYTETGLPVGNYERCTFIKCESIGRKLGNSVFDECRFTACNFANATVDKTSFRSAVFVGCKLTGVDFSLCNELLLSVSFEDCVLDYATFSRLSLKNTMFRNCSMIRTYFEATDLSGAVFDRCTLTNAVFLDSKLTKTDFTSATDFMIDPDRNKMKNAKFSLIGAIGLLTKYGIVIE